VTPVNTQMRGRGHRNGPIIGKIDGQAGFLGFFRDFGGGVEREPLYTVSHTVEHDMGCQLSVSGLCLRNYFPCPIIR
jgi:hypothetical protein